jgi:hypothetical protein
MSSRPPPSNRDLLNKLFANPTPASPKKRPAPTPEDSAAASTRRGDDGLINPVPPPKRARRISDPQLELAMAVDEEIRREAEAAEQEERDRQNVEAARQRAAAMIAADPERYASPKPCEYGARKWLQSPSSGTVRNSPTLKLTRS